MAKQSAKSRRFSSENRVSQSPAIKTGAKDAKTSQAMNTSASLFAGGGDMGARMAEVDWGKTPLGPVESWPQNLKTCVRIVLTARQPMFVWWGDSLINLYNDAYISILGGKHPEALGKPARQIWREIWDQIGPRAAAAMERNEGTYDEALLLIMERYGYREETYYTFSYSPVPNDQGGTGGIICANSPETEKIVGERQMGLLRDLAAQTSDATNWRDVCRVAAETFRHDPRDLCFTLIYLHDPTRDAAFLAAKSAIDEGNLLAPETLKLGDDAVWPLNKVLTAHEMMIVPLSDVHGLIPIAPWNTPPTQAALLPITASGTTGLSGVMIVGLNPFRHLDSNYKGFLSLVAGQLSASIAHAQAYEEEKKRAEMLAELDRVKTTFFSNVSHEFRTPLTLMLGPTEDGLNSPERSLRGRALETVHRNQLRLLKLVNTLLEFSRLEAGRTKVRYQPSNLAQVTSELVSVFRSAFERAGLALVVNCDELAQPVYIDRDMWERVVLNLLSNALKSTFDGAITVRLRDAGDHCELSIQDTGTGIPDHELPHLFERFRRIEGARRRTHEGSGIGLALVHELVKMHGGSIGVTSKLGKGTAFTISVPYGIAHLPSDHIDNRGAAESHVGGTAAFVQEALSWLPDSDSSSKLLTDTIDSFGLDAAENGSAPAPGRRFRVLLADDNRDMRDYVTELLSSRFDVTAAENGRVALEMALKNPPDVVLSDIMMPDMDGFELLAEIRSNPETQTIPVILLSARAGEESRVEGMEAGADDYLIKPFTARELVARVEAHAKIAQFRQEAFRREADLERELQAVRELAANAIEHIGDGFFTVDRDWKFQYINAAGERLIAAAGGPEDAAGTTLWQCFPELLGTDAEVQCHRCMEQRAHIEVEAPYGRRWYLMRAYPSPQDGITIYFADVSARKRAEENLRMKQEHLLLTQRAAKIGAWELDMEEEDLTISAEFAEIAGLPSYVSRLRYSEFLNALFFSTDRAELRRALEFGLRGKRDFSLELRLRRPDDSVRLVIARGKIFYNQGKPVVLGVLVDITPREDRKQQPHAAERTRKFSPKGIRGKRAATKAGDSHSF